MPDTRSSSRGSLISCRPPPTTDSGKSRLRAWNAARPDRASASSKKTSQAGRGSNERVSNGRSVGLDCLGGRKGRTLCDVQVAVDVLGLDERGVPGEM